MSERVTVAIPRWIYAAILGLAITAGWGLVSLKWEYPWWAWLLHFAVMYVVAFVFARFVKRYDKSRDALIVSKQRWIIDVIVCPVAFIIAIVVNLLV